MSLGERFGRFLNSNKDLKAELEEIDNQLDQKPATPVQQKVVSTKPASNVMALRQQKSESVERDTNNYRPRQNVNQPDKKIMLFEPRLFADVNAIANRLLHGEPTIINFEKMSEEQAYRVLDFLSGVIFAIEGEMERIGSQIFLCTPKHYRIEGDLSQTQKTRTSFKE